MPVGGEDFIEVGRDLDAVVFEILEPGPLRPNRVSQDFGDFAESHGDFGLHDRRREFVFTGVELQVRAHRRSSLMWGEIWTSLPPRTKTTSCGSGPPRIHLAIRHTIGSPPATP